LDTVLVNTLPCTGRVASNADRDVYIGKDPWGTTFNGLIDEVRIYDRALPQNEIADLFLGKFSGLTAPFPTITHTEPTVRMLTNPLTGPDCLRYIQQNGVRLLSLSGRFITGDDLIKGCPSGVCFIVDDNNNVIQKVILIK
jgi:hypothetical protein